MDVTCGATMFTRLSYWSLRSVGMIWYDVLVEHFPCHNMGPGGRNHRTDDTHWGPRRSRWGSRAKGPPPRIHRFSNNQKIDENQWFPPRQHGITRGVWKNMEEPFLDVCLFHAVSGRRQEALGSIRKHWLPRRTWTGWWQVSSFQKCWKKCWPSGGCSMTSWSMTMVDMPTALSYTCVCNGDWTMVNDCLKPQWRTDGEVKNQCLLIARCGEWLPNGQSRMQRMMFHHC